MSWRQWICMFAAGVAITAVCAVAIAQRGRGYRREFRPGEVADRGGVPAWKNDEQFKDDVFIFTRVRFQSYGGWGGRGGKWSTDYPDADLNLSYRLQQLTTIESDPNGRVIELTDDTLFDYPLIYMVEPGHIYFEEEEVLALRKYCLSGGFLWVDDFWTEYEWDNFYGEIKRVFPDREPEELPLEHPIFHCVYEFKEKPQVPSIHAWYDGLKAERGTEGQQHYRAIKDDKGRIMALICHNTDVGDGWEREGMDPGYFKEYSEKYSYPMGINIVTYAMTH
ncbi:MAG: DUF4159 domain-containing protein [Planctomycetaceae bacterium]|nr:DUF4159 domain-containing protein [Planctomycetaceae bacterium]